MLRASSNSLEDSDMDVDGELVLVLSEMNFSGRFVLAPPVLTWNESYIAFASSRLEPEPL